MGLQRDGRTILWFCGDVLMVNISIGAIIATVNKLEQWKYQAMHTADFTDKNFVYLGLNIIFPLPLLLLFVRFLLL